MVSEVTEFPLPPGCRYAVIGDPVEHSRSPAMQNAAFEHYGLGSPYAKVRVPDDQLAPWMDFARRNLAGFNVTVPHKQAVIPFLDQISDAASLAGSVNTVTVTPDGKLHGDSTDGYGLVTALEEGFEMRLAGWSFALVGAGGAARAAAFALAGAGARAIAVINRTEARADALAQQLRRHVPGLSVSVWQPDDAGLGELLASVAVTVQTTSLGLSPADPLPLPQAALIRSRAIFDAIYGLTPTVRLALTYDIPVLDGIGMLLHQGARAFEIWTGRSAPVTVMRQALEHGR